MLEGVGPKWPDPHSKSIDATQNRPAFGAVSTFYGLIGIRRVGLFTCTVAGVGPNKLVSYFSR